MMCPLRSSTRNIVFGSDSLISPSTSIASSFNVIKAFDDEIKTIDKAIVKTIKGINTTEYQSLVSIPGIGPVLASGILAEQVVSLQK